MFYPIYSYYFGILQHINELILRDSKILFYIKNKIGMNRKFTLLAMCAVFFTTLRLSAQAPVFTDTYAAGVTFSAFGGSTNDVTIDNTVFQSGTRLSKLQFPLPVIRVEH